MTQDEKFIKYLIKKHNIKVLYQNIEEFDE